MCFILHPKFKEPIIALQDIKCFKTLSVKNQVFSSPSYLFYWEPGILQKKISLEVDEFDEINQGFHSYMLPFFHHYLSLFEFRIPKGTKYYINPKIGQFVSETIIFVSDKPILKNEK